MGPRFAGETPVSGLLRWYRAIHGKRGTHRRQTQTGLYSATVGEITHQPTDFQMAYTVYKIS